MKYYTFDQRDAPMDIHPINGQSEPTIALLPWGDVWEDFLDSIGVSLEAFCNEGPGGWMLGYMDTLRLYGVRTVLILMSARVTAPRRFMHAPTGATISVLPVPKSYRAIRRRMVSPYPSFGGSVEQMFGDVQGARRMVFKVLNQVAPYLTTPLKLLVHELQREGCNAILCQEYEYFRFDICVLLGRLMHMPVFATFQGGGSEKNLLGRFLRPLTMRACSGLVIGPRTEIERVRTRYHVHPARIAQIFNPIDVRMWQATDRGEARAALGLPDNARVVVWHGRVDIHHKGLDVLLEAWQRVCCEREGQDLRLLLMGTGTDAEKLRQRIATMQLQNVVWVNEYITDRAAIRHFLSAGDVYAFPSRHEGFAVAPIEAMACGLPLVAADAPGIADICEDGEASGGLVTPRNDVAAFALALGRLLDDEAWRREMGRRARRRAAERFSLEVVGQQLRTFMFQASAPTHRSATE